MNGGDKIEITATRGEPTKLGVHMTDVVIRVDGVVVYSTRIVSCALEEQKVTYSDIYSKGFLDASN